MYGVKSSEENERTYVKNNNKVAICHTKLPCIFDNH